MSDWSQVSVQKHELDYILEKEGRGKSESNRTILKGIVQDFKKSKGSSYTKDYTKDPEFYTYLRNRTDFKKLEKIAEV